VSRGLRLRAREAARTSYLVWRVLCLAVFLIFAAAGAMMIPGAIMLADSVPVGDVAVILGLGLLYLFGGFDELRLFLNWLRGRPPRFRP
jgi:hypothetical protein